MQKLLCQLILMILVGCDAPTDSADDAGVADAGGLVPGRADARPVGDACAPTCRLGADGVGCLCTDGFGQDVYCRDVPPAGNLHSCCGVACR
jgi:hypothetical protein